MEIFTERLFFFIYRYFVFFFLIFTTKSVKLCRGLVKLYKSRVPAYFYRKIFLYSYQFNIFFFRYFVSFRFHQKYVKLCRDLVKACKFQVPGYFYSRKMFVFLFIYNNQFNIFFRYFVFLWFSKKKKICKILQRLGKTLYNSDSWIFLQKVFFIKV